MIHGSLESRSQIGLPPIGVRLGDETVDERVAVRSGGGECSPQRRGGDVDPAAHPRPHAHGALRLDLVEVDDSPAVERAQMHELLRPPGEFEEQRPEQHGEVRLGAEGPDEPVRGLTEDVGPILVVLNHVPSPHQPADQAMNRPLVDAGPRGHGAERHPLGTRGRHRLENIESTVEARHRRWGRGICSHAAIVPCRRHRSASLRCPAGPRALRLRLHASTVHFAR